MTTEAAPAPAPTPTPQAAPPRAVGLAAGLGLAAAAVVPSGPPGVGLVLVAGGGGVLAVRLAGTGLRGWRLAHALTALALVASAAVRDAPWLVAGCLAGAAAVGSIALTPGRTWAGVLTAPLLVPRALPAAAPWLVRGAQRWSPDVGAVLPAVRGLGATVLLLVLFVPLLTSADAAFASLLTSLAPQLPSPDLLTARTVTGAAAAVLAAAVLQLLLRPRPEPTVSSARRPARRAEWLPPLLALDLLLAAFLLVQGSVLLGSADHVLQTAGVTYASYAREGFGQLVTVTALVLAVVAAAARWAPRGARPLLGLLCGLALVVDASALMRLNLYVEAYGLSRLRIAAVVLAAWLGVVLLLVLVAGRRPGRWLPHGVALSASGCLLLLVVANPDARIAESALGLGARADLAYVRTLSADAVPVLDRLPEPARSCLLPRPADDLPWTSANLARARAAALASRPLTGACTVLPG